MSRVGKKPITIPQGVEIKEENSLVTVKGPNGVLTFPIKPYVTISIEDGQLSVSIKNERDKFQKAMWGTTRAIINNHVTGVTQKFKQQLELNGVGFRMELGQKLTLYIGYSHPVEIEIPQQITLTLNKNILIGESVDKQILGDFFTTIHDMKPADPYKHKGFKFPGRYYPKKAGKKAK